MILTNTEILNDVPVLAAYGTQPLPLKVAYAFGKSLVGLTKEYDVLTTARRSAIRNAPLVQGPDDKDLVVGVDDKGEKQYEFVDKEALEVELVDLSTKEVEVSIHVVSLDTLPEDIPATVIAAMLRCGLLADD